MKTKTPQEIFEHLAEALSRVAHSGNPIFAKSDPDRVMDLMARQVPTLCRHHVVAVGLLVAALHAMEKEEEETEERTI